MGKKLTRISRNLYLQTLGKSRTWIFRYCFQGRTRDLGLGPLSRVTVAKAEALADEMRDKIDRGIDPQQERGGRQPKTLSFKEIAASRRLKLRAAANQTQLFLLRHRSNGGTTVAQGRWRVSALRAGPKENMPATRSWGRHGCGSPWSAWEACRRKVGRWDSMARVICIWLPFWKTDRLERQGSGVKLHEPATLAVITEGKGGKRLLALNAGAQEAGLRTGMLLTDACAMLPSLAAAPRASCSIRADISQS